MSFHSGDPARKGHSFLIKFLGSFGDAERFCTPLGLPMPLSADGTDMAAPGERPISRPRQLAVGGPGGI